jgi:hypothetical protein
MKIITYHFQLQNEETFSFEVNLGRDNSTPSNLDEHRKPFWTKLHFNQCPNCILDNKLYFYCPVALDFQEIADRFKSKISIETADVWVVTKERSYYSHCAISEGLKSLFGLIMASSGCPTLSRLKPLAYFHLPFASFEETVHRVFGTYLIKQYLVYHEKKAKPDWDLKGLSHLYQELSTINIHLLNRLRAASSKDANVNALYTFVALTSLIEMGIDESLSDIMPILKKGL